jgi:hypothetical protein
MIISTHGIIQGRAAGVPAGLPDIYIGSNLKLWLSSKLTQSYPGTGTAWTDLSVYPATNGRNYTLNATPSFTNGVMSFAGTNFADKTSSTPAFVGSYPLTISAWFMITETQWNGIVGCNTSTGFDNQFSFKVQNTGKFEFHIGSGAYFSVIDDTPITNGVWYNYTIVSTQLTTPGHTNLKMYRNAELIKDVLNIFDKTYPEANGNIVIAKNFYQRNAVDLLKGKLGDILIYNEALTQSQITQNYNNIIYT